MPLLGREKVEFELKEGIKTRINSNLKGVYFGGLDNIIAATPADEGLHRNAWFLSVGAPSGSTTKSKSTAGASSIRQLAKMPKSVIGKKIYFTNNAPAITTLEYGGYPSPVAKGSYIKAKKKYEILSINGFSTQAPKGWVRSTIIAMQNKLRSL